MFLTEGLKLKRSCLDLEELAETSFPPGKMHTGVSLFQFEVFVI